MAVISLANLSLLSEPPPTLIDLAAQAGFDAVGLRLTGPPGRVPFPMLCDPKLQARTLAALKRTGIDVLDIEVLRLGPAGMGLDISRLLEVAANFGATELVTIGDDVDHSRASEQLAHLASTAAPYGLGVALEPMRLSAVRSFDDAAKIVAASGASNAHVLIDPVHIARFGATPSDLAASPDALAQVTYAQLCDGLTAAPDDLEQEARGERLAPGEGQLPLLELLALLPDKIPLSLEVPSARSVAQFGPLWHAQRLMTHVRELLAQPPLSSAPSN